MQHAAMESDQQSLMLKHPESDPFGEVFLCSLVASPLLLILTQEYPRCLSTSPRCFWIV